MGFLKMLFGNGESTPEYDKEKEERRQFDMFKYDGVKAASMGRYDFAAECYREALRIHDDEEVHDYLSTALLRQGKGEEAVEELKLLQQRHPDDRHIMHRIARVAYINEDYDLMRRQIAKALADDADDADSLFLAAQCDIGLGAFDEAVKILSHAIDVRTDFGDAYLLRGQTLFRIGNYDEAQTDCDYLLTHAQSNEDVLLLKARIAQAKGENALPIYNKVIDLNPFNTDALRERARLRRLTGDEKGAKEDESQLAEVDPEAGDNLAQDGVEAKVRQAYRDVDVFGIFS